MSDAKLDEVYYDRNLCVALLARLCMSNRWPAGTTKASDAEPGFSRVLIIETPEGQISWHYPDEMEPFFAAFQKFPDDAWDGHTTPEKFERMKRVLEQIDQITAQLSRMREESGS